jgi:hypothetical protein
MNLLPEIFKQATARITRCAGANSEPAALRSARLAKQPRYQPASSAEELTSLVLHEAALKLAYVGHCGRPGKRGGSRPKSQCGALPVGAARTGTVSRDSRSPNAYTVERSVQKTRGKPEERITRVIYEKRRNPEEQRSWVKDSLIDTGRNVARTVLPAAIIGGALYALGKKARLGLRAGGATFDFDFGGGKADDVADVMRGAPTPPPTSGQGSPPTPKKAPTNGRGSQNGGHTSNGIRHAPNGEPVPTTPYIPPNPQGPKVLASRTTAPRRRQPDTTLDRLSDPPSERRQPANPKAGLKKASDDLGTYLTGLNKRRMKNPWTQQGGLSRRKGGGYYLTIQDRAGRTQRLEYVFDGKKWVWKKS